MTPRENVRNADEISTVIRDDNAMLGLGIPERHDVPVAESWAALVKPGDENSTEYGDMIAQLRDFLNYVTAARPDSDTVAALRDDLERWGRRLAPMAVPERDQMFGHLRDLHGRGQTMSPTFVATEADRDNVWGTVRFGRYFLGGNGAVHGGAIPLFFDEVLGRLANSSGRRHSRTAYLNTDYRSVTPVGVDLTVHGWFVSEEGRKRVLRAELRSGDVVCAEAEGLFVRLNPGQP
ncbi:PaaI family thioesterase [Rhodococcus sp. (in: high G+C Gram-positive bacteria)]|uniref:Acyl-coenzyme A thioesterase THEM4 n=1 Tax=Rhodococcus baikonurensis TaxID=172041 RepID=A0ABV5XFR6_9NOCA